MTSLRDPFGWSDQPPDLLSFPTLANDATSLAPRIKPIRLEGDLLESDLAEALRVAHDPYGWEKYGWVFSMGTLWFATWRSSCYPWALPFTIACLSGAAFVMILAARHASWRRRARTMMCEQRAIAAHQFTLITDEGLDVQADWSSCRYAWAAFRDVRLSRTVVLLLGDMPNGFVICPRSLFPSERAWRQFVRLVRARVPSR